MRLIKFKRFENLDGIYLGDAEVNTIRLGKSNRYFRGAEYQAYDEASKRHFTFKVTRIITNTQSSVIRNHAKNNHTCVARGLRGRAAIDFITKALPKHYRSDKLANEKNLTAVYFEIQKIENEK